MRIASVSIQPWNVELLEPFGIATGAQLMAENVLLELVLDSGIVGLGEAAPCPAVSGETQAQALAALYQRWLDRQPPAARRWKVSEEASRCAQGDTLQK